MLAQVPHIGLSMVPPSRNALEDGSELSRITATRVTLYRSRQQSYLKKSYDQIQAIITDG